MSENCTLGKHVQLLHNWILSQYVSFISIFHNSTVHQPAPFFLCPQENFQAICKEQISYKACGAFVLWQNTIQQPFLRRPPVFPDLGCFCCFFFYNALTKMQLLSVPLTLVTNSFFSFSKQGNSTLIRVTLKCTDFGDFQKKNVYVCSIFRHFKTQAVQQLTCFMRMWKKKKRDI